MDRQGILRVGEAGRRDDEGGTGERTRSSAV